MSSEIRTEYYEFLITERIRNRPKKLKKKKKKMNRNPPSIIPNLNFYMTTTRPYWLLQQNRTHLSFN